MDTPEHIPARIGRFAVSRRIGRGLHGEVFHAHDPHLARDVAVKLLHPRRRDGDETLVVPDEARILAVLRHPNIVSVYEAGLHEDEPYFVMEYVRGTTLRTLLDREHRLSSERALAVMAGVLAGMAHAHAAGVSHLDLSPANVLLDASGVPRLMDFGLSRRADHAAETSELLVGTPRYMAPEHFDFTGLGPHTDVYALGLILFEMLTGRPVVGDVAIRDVPHVVGSEPPDWDLLHARCGDSAVHALLRVALAKDPGARYADASAVLNALAPVAPASAATADKHATIAFLLRRMQRRQDFPALSRNLAEINRLTAPDADSSAGQLANVVLRDYAITNKLLKLANSAYYGGSSRKRVENVTDAVTLLGFERVRATCNGLVYFSHFGGAAQGALLDTLVASFVTGLMARHVAGRMGLRDVEDAFLCGMFRSLGKSLTLYYFAEEYQEIERLVRNGGDETACARGVLGISYDELAVAVTSEWKFPEYIVQSLLPLAPGTLPKPAERGEALAAASGFASGLVQLVALPEGIWREAMLEGHVQRFAACLPMTAPRARELLAAALARYREFAPLLGVPVDRVRFLRAAGELAGDEATRQREPGAENAGGGREPQVRPAKAEHAARPRPGLMARARRWLERSSA